MSTKSTILSKEKIHLYKECFDDENFYIDIFDTDTLSVDLYPVYSNNKQKSKVTFKISKKDFKDIINKVKTFDVTGASDTFVALLANNIFVKNTVEKSIKVAISCATKVVQKKYTSVILKKEYNKIKKRL